MRAQQTKDADDLGCDDDADEVERIMMRCYGIHEPVPNYENLMDAIKAAHMAAWYLVDEQYIAEATCQIEPLCRLTDRSTAAEKVVVVDGLEYMASIVAGDGFEALMDLLIHSPMSKDSLRL